MRKVLKILNQFRDGLFVVLPLAVLTGFLSLVFAVDPVSEAFQGRLTAPRSLQFPIAMDFDLQENLYVIDNNSRRIMSFSPSGKERWALKGGKRSNGFYESYRLAALPGGGVLVHNCLRDPLDGSLDGEEILSYSNSGSLEGTLVRLMYTKGSKNREHIGAFVIHGNSLRYLFQEQGEVLVRERPVAVGGTEDPGGHKVVFSAELPSNFEVVNAVLHLPEGLVMIERSGKVYLLDATGNVTEPFFARNDPMQKPWDLKAGVDGRLYFLDVLGRSVWKAKSLDSRLEQVFGQAEVLKTGRGKPSFESLAIAASGTLGIVDKGNQAVYLKKTDGTVVALEGGAKSEFEQWNDVFWVLVAAFSVLSGLWSVVGLLRRFLATRISIVVKQVALLLPLVIVSSSIGSVSIFRLLENSYDEETRATLTFIATLGSQTIDGTLAAALTKASDFQSPPLLKLEQQINDLIHAGTGFANQSIHAVVWKYSGDDFFSLTQADPPLGVMYPFSRATREHYSTARGAQMQFTRYAGEYGSLVSALAPLKGLSGEVTSVLEVFHYDDASREMFSSYTDNLFKGAFFSVMLVLLLLIGSDLLLFLALGLLQKNTESPRESYQIGNFAQHPIRLSGQMLNHLGRLGELRHANARFVSTELLGYLGKGSLAELESGDHLQHKATLLLARLRNLSTVTKGMSPEETFPLINAYLSEIGPVIRRHGGFIQRYRSEHFLAIFPGQPGDAVSAGLAIHEATVRGQWDVGMGIHRQEVLIGVVGEPNRLALNLLSDAPQLVHQAQEAGTTFDVKMTITESVWSSLPLALRAGFLPLGNSEHFPIGLKFYGR